MRNSPDPALSRVDDVPGALDYRAWFFTWEYRNIPPDALFNSVTKSLQDFHFFKVSKVE